jgi:toxin ParE1/3/4
MSYHIIFLPQARADLLDAFHWYQAKQHGLGHEFRFSVNESLSKLAAYPGIYPRVHLHVRRALIRRFPFGIFYFIEETSVIVLAVAHARRDPGNWKARI